MEDRDEKFTTTRDLIEYHAGFIEPGLVSKVRQERDEQDSRKKGGIGTDDDAAFSESVRQMFGRDLSIPDTDKNKISDSEVHHIKNVSNKIKEYEMEKANQIINTTPYNYRHWVDIDMEME
jgi:hypothetical protein